MTGSSIEAYENAPALILRVWGSIPSIKRHVKACSLAKITIQVKRQTGENILFVFHKSTTLLIITGPLSREESQIRVTNLLTMSSKSHTRSITSHNLKANLMQFKFFLIFQICFIGKRHSDGETETPSRLSVSLSPTPPWTLTHYSILYCMSCSYIAELPLLCVESRRQEM
jgi:hypothetical protein